jgi:hypothetical protein
LAIRPAHDKVDDPTGSFPNPTLGSSGVTVYSTMSGSSTATYGSFTTPVAAIRLTMNARSSVGGQVTATILRGLSQTEARVDAAPTIRNRRRITFARKSNRKPAELGSPIAYLKSRKPFRMKSRKTARRLNKNRLVSSLALVTVSSRTLLA